MSIRKRFTRPKTNPFLARIKLTVEQMV